MLGEQYMAAVVALLDALENTQGVEVFGEWQHQEYLVSQLSCSLRSLVLCDIKEFVLRNFLIFRPAEPLLAGARTATSFIRISNPQTSFATMPFLLDFSSSNTCIIKAANVSFYFPGMQVHVWP